MGKSFKVRPGKEKEWADFYKKTFVQAHNSKQPGLLKEEFCIEKGHFYVPSLKNYLTVGEGGKSAASGVGSFL